MSSLSAPSAPPQDVRITDTSTTEIQVTWQGVECIYRNTEITSFIVQYDPPSSDGTSEVLTPGDGDQGGSVTLAGLTLFTNYTIKVAANSDKGYGPFTDELTGMTDQDSESVDH